MIVFKHIRIAIRGGGDLGSGIAFRLHRAGFPVLITELPHPLLVRRTVSFGSAAIDGEITLEGITARLAESLPQAIDAQHHDTIPVMIDEDGGMLIDYQPTVLIDARMLKTDPGAQPIKAPLIVGLGPGFDAPYNCDAVIETNRGHHLGRVIWRGSAEPDTNIPGKVLDQQSQRVLRAPSDGVIHAIAHIGDRVEYGESIAEISGNLLAAPFAGVLRGLIHDGTWVSAGLKIGDIDPRAKPEYAFTISDKSLAVAGGVLEAILSSPVIQQRLLSA
jgi:xanthine dehydrogenase accessory factor